MNSVCCKVFTNQPFSNVPQKIIFYVSSSTFFLFSILASWSIGENRNLFLQLKSKLRLYHVVLTTPKTSPESFTQTVLEMQQLPDIEKIDTKEIVSCHKEQIMEVGEKFAKTSKLIQTN